MKVTMSDIAQKLNTSVVTVSKALANKAGVSQELRDKILKTAQEMGYHKHHDSPKNKSLNIGILIADHFVKNNTSSCYWTYYQELIKHLYHYGFTGVLDLITNQRMQELSPPVFCNQQIDGVIIIGNLDEAYIRKYIVDRYSCAIIDDYNPHLNLCAFLNDNYNDAYFLTNYLIENGHQKIGFIGSIHSTNSILDRFMGYQKSLIENHLTIEPKWFFNDRDAEGEYIPLIFPEDLPTAFVCNCDEVAYSLILQLKSMGYRVPEDISVVAFDNMAYSELSVPKITTVQINSMKISQMAIQYLLRIINGSSTNLGKLHFCAGSIIIKESVKTIKE